MKKFLKKFLRKIFKYKTTILAMVVLVYLFFNVITYFGNKTMKTEALEYSTIEDKIRKKGVIIRMEEIIKSKDSGSLEYKVEGGDRVKKGQNLANVYNDKIYSEISKQIEKIDEDIEKLQSNSIVSKDIEKIEVEMNNLVSDIKANIDVEKNQKKLEKLISKKEELSKKEDVTKTIKNKKEERQLLLNKFQKYCKEQVASSAGIVSFDLDGYEENLKFSNIKELQISDIKNITNDVQNVGSKSKINSGEKLLKIMDNHKIYIAVELKDKESYNLDLNQSVNLNINKKEVKSKVYFKKKENPNSNLVIFEINEQITEIFDTRVQEFDIIYKKLEGLKIPKKSVIEKDNAKGVYIVSKTGSSVFKELQGISGENEDFYVINYHKNKREGIDTVNIHDEIVSNPKKAK